FPKARVAVSVKIIEIMIMILAAYGFKTHSYPLLFVCLFLMGLHSTFFGPVKYSILPELVTETELVAGNAYVELGTFLAILIGTVSSGVAMAHPEGAPAIMGGLIVIAVLGLLMSLAIPKTPGALPDLPIAWNPVSDTMRTLKLALPNRAVFHALLGISWFWFLGGALLSILPVLTESHLQADAGVVTYFLGLFTVGIAVGSVLAEKLSHERVEIGLVPLGSIGMSVGLFCLSLFTHLWPVRAPHSELLTLAQFIHAPHAWGISFSLVGIAVSGGIFTVPLYTLMQSRSERSIRSRIVGANNVMNALFMVVSAVLLLGFYAAGLSMAAIFVIYGFFNLGVAIYIYRMVPEFLLRFMTFLLSSLLYRLQVKGQENIPQTGAAILVCNHVSFIDWCLIGGAIKRPVRFVMSSGM
ncbi:MAG: MFS transporter, partial [Proteobacteria bacterium]